MSMEFFIAKTSENRSRFHESSSVRSMKSEISLRISLESELREEINFLREQITNLITQHSIIQISSISMTPSISDRSSFSENRDNIILNSYLIIKFFLSRMITDEILNLSHLFIHLFK